MTIKQLWKVEGTGNDYETEQEAQIAECIYDAEGIYVDARTTAKIAKALSDRYFLVPIIPTITIQESEREQEDSGSPT